MRIEGQKKAIETWFGALFFFCFLCACPVWGAGADATTLSGIEGFRVEIGTISKTALELGVDESRLRVLTRERLRRDNLSVGDFPAALIISLRTVEHPTTVVAYCLEVEVRQVVHLTRTSQIHLLAPTWVNGALTMVTRASFVRSVEDALAGSLDELVRDYRLVNQN
ncbi:MAG TPA: hypothetical protein VKK81_27415 [Candidatus Binatia bacterium]|nr:hypothetical protein [Candidatus Binatia bacterium]